MQFSLTGYAPVFFLLSSFFAKFFESIMQSELSKIQDVFHKDRASGAVRLDLEARGLSRAAVFLSMAVSSMEKGGRGPILWVCQDMETAHTRARELKTLLSCSVCLLPPLEELLFMPIVPSRGLVSERIQALDALASMDDAVVVAPVEALAEPLPPHHILSSVSETVSVDDEIGRDILADWLVDAGYEPCRIVTRIGEFAVRGGIVDIFSPGLPYPVRLDFFDDMVESIRYFHPDSQRSMKELEQARLLPVTEFLLDSSMIEKAKGRLISKASKLGISASAVTEIRELLSQRRTYEMHCGVLPILYENPGRLMDYLGAEGSMILEQPAESVHSLEQTLEERETLYQDALARERVFAGFTEYLLPVNDLSRGFRKKRRIMVWASDIYRDAGLSDGFDSETPLYSVRVDIQPLSIPSLSLSFRKGRELFSPVAEMLQEWVNDEGCRVILLASDDGQLRRIRSLLSHYGLQAEELCQSACDRGHPEVTGAGPCLGRVVSWSAGQEPGLFLHVGWLQEAASIPDLGVKILPDHLIFQIARADAGREGKRRHRKGVRPVSAAELKAGELVVHRDHGIGRYIDLELIEINGIEGEYFVLEYAAGDKLYLPVDRIGLLTPYVGVEGREPRLDKLGSRSWHTRKGKVKKALQEIAHDLVDLYAQRKLARGVAFSPPDEMFRQFEMDFPYEETRDQAAAIQDVISDMEQPQPMDRLVCGDVGYGKTEVAMRAAFKAVEDGYQVAVLVPTTLLAEQHERTFRKRFKRFPVCVEALSRMKPPRMQKAIAQAVRDGSVDILIGTHKILGMAHLFRRLGLLIIDEEHRFGVRHKEQIKKITATVDCLTLTATPIPRTLQLSLLGLRDLSTIETEPPGRQSVSCFLAEADDSIIRNAILRELDRGGQVFFVHNRIAGLERIAEKVKRLVPQARTALAHGRMDPAELERIMVSFVRGEIDCLVSTTIIESGLDIPSANTLIVNRADMLGLAELYQLKGRVGRASTKAYAYFLVPHLPSLGKDAVQRLKAFMEAAEDGGGMGLSMQDLRIRGGGNLLGLVQTGRVADVGYDLYLDLLAEAVAELQGKDLEPELDPEINLGSPAFIPQEYIPDIASRVETYRRLSRAGRDGAGEEQSLIEIALELEDRFGPLPPEVKNLISVMEIKGALVRLRALKLEKAVSQDPKGRARIVLTFGPQGPPGVDALLKAAADGRIHLLPDSRIALHLKPGTDHQEFLANVLKGLNELIGLTKKT